MGNQYSKRFRTNANAGSSSSPNSSKKKKDKEEADRAKEADDAQQGPPIVPLLERVIEGWKEHHYLTKDYWGGNFIAPVHEWLRIGGSKVLDMGCGTGTWLDDVAMEYPLTEFIGVDILSLHSERYPANVEFIQTDIRYTLPFPDNTFDFIHMRHMILNFTYHEWTNTVIPELLRVLKPGGYLELTEADMEWCNISPTTKMLISSVHNTMRQKGLDPFMINRLYDILENTEKLDHIYQRTNECQIGMWGGKNGATLLRMSCELFDNIRAKMCETLKIPNEEFDVFVQNFKEDTDTYKTYCKGYKFYAAKRLT